MQALSLDQIVGLERYERIRDEFRRRIIELKKSRRIAVGEFITFVFENRETVLFQIQEMLRAEQITDLDKVRGELDCYNPLLPASDELSSTMLIEVTEQDQIRSRLLSLSGIEQAVRIEIGKHIVAGQFEAGRSKEDKLSAVQYVRFRFDEPTRSLFVSGVADVRLVIDHPNYRATTAIEGAARESLAADLCCTA